MQLIDWTGTKATIEEEAQVLHNWGSQGCSEADLLTVIVQCAILEGLRQLIAQLSKSRIEIEPGY